MVADELRRLFAVSLYQKRDNPFEGIDQQLILVRRRFLQGGLADVEEVAGVHAVDAVQLNIFRRKLELRLHRLLGFGDVLHELAEQFRC